MRDAPDLLGGFAAPAGLFRHRLDRPSVQEALPRRRFAVRHELGPPRGERGKGIPEHTARLPAPAEPDLLRRVAELESETTELLAEVREHIRRSRDLRREARVLCDFPDGTAQGP